MLLFRRLLQPDQSTTIWVKPAASGANTPVKKLFGEDSLSHRGGCDVRVNGLVLFDVYYDVHVIGMQLVIFSEAYVDDDANAVVSFCPKQNRTYHLSPNRLWSLVPLMSYLPSCEIFVVAIKTCASQACLCRVFTARHS
jgi:hypothetical protein